MKRMHLLLCVIGCAIFSIAQNNIATLSLSHIGETHIQQCAVIQSDTTITLDYPETITGLSVSGTATLNHASNSLVRVTLQDDYNTEWLVYELFPLLADSSTVIFSNVAFETSILENITAKQLNVTIINATLTLSDINTSNQSVASYSIQQNRAMEAQNAYIIEKLNENLEKRNIPWRAGETSVSRKTYEEKKAMFGGKVPNLGGLEYYKGGIFIMPDYEPTDSNEGVATLSTTEEEEDPYVKEWDWRNRHGKNWMTPAKDQDSCGSCWAFAAMGAVEAYCNLYYNRQLNLDLSEQELVSCTYKSRKGCNGGHPSNALNYIKKNGVMNENSFPYIIVDNNCDDKPDISTERIKIGNYIYRLGDRRKYLFNSPLAVSLYKNQHDVVLAGYKTVQAGEEYISENLISKITIEEGNSLIGTKAWLLKNSWGEDWGDNGFAYVITNDLNDTYSITDSIVSLNYNDSDIVIEDLDNDGYYTWGLRAKPDSLPDWVPETPDGDDSNPDYGPIDQYGHLQKITLGSPITVATDEHWNEDNYLYSNIIIVNGGSLTISSNIILYKDACVTVESGGELIIDNGCIEQANITLKAGANMNIQNNGNIILGSADNFVTEIGATLNIYSGGIKLKE